LLLEVLTIHDQLNEFLVYAYVRDAHSHDSPVVVNREEAAITVVKIQIKQTLAAV
jgi:hypothetical protein